MKKLTLQPKEINGAEVLTRDQLKRVLGGISQSSSLPLNCTPPTFYCECDSGSGGFGFCADSIAQCEYVCL